MQQTETYKLNLIETTDPFSPAALNENTRKMEEVVHEKLGEMDQRVTVLEGHKFACGVYSSPTGNPVHINLGFAPKAVFVRHLSNGNSESAMSVEGPNGQSPYLALTEDGFTVHSLVHNPHAFIAFA